MKTVDFTRGTLLITSFLILVAGLAMPAGSMMTSIIGALIIFSLIIVDIQAPQIAGLSEDNPKVKTMRFLNRLTMVIVIIYSTFTLLSKATMIVESETGGILAIGLLSMFMMVFGNLAPKIPFNRYLGLRLPWTIRDEDTWKVAHRIVGYLSFPVALLMFVAAFFFESDKVAITGILTWIIIPGAYSLVFYYRKLKKG